jgi:hypothetical protein
MFWIGVKSVNNFSHRCGPTFKYKVVQNKKCVIDRKRLDDTPQKDICESELLDLSVRENVF